MEFIIKYLLVIFVFGVISCQAKEGVELAEKTVAKEEESKEPMSLFDGESLEGWKVVNPKNAKFWSAKDGVIEASNGDKKMPVNTYLASAKEYGDFEFTCEFRLSGDHATGLINSGIQYRSVLKKHKKRGFIIIGYQADIGRGWWGGIYDEHRRGKLVKGDAAALLATDGFKDDSWHTYRIVCKGNKHELFINGIATAFYTEKNEKIPAKGVIALQLHSGGVAKIQYRNIKIKTL